MTKYSDEMIAKIKEIGTFNYDSAQAFAKSNDISFRSVIAKIRSIPELEYIAKGNTKANATKPKARAKADIVASVNKLIDVDLKSFDKMTVKDLEVLERELQVMLGVDA